jgi:Skp family chaperone for outer membrane proteins
MSKLTAEQKLANKAAQKVRDRAYADRRRAYRVARDSAERAAEESVFAKNRDAAVEAMEQEWRNRNEVCNAIEREIQALREKLERTKAQYEVSFEPKRQAHNDAQRAFQEHLAILRASVEASFPDMKDCWYVSQWEIPSDVRAAMDAAAANARGSA